MFWKLSCLLFLTIAVGVSEPGGDQLQDTRRLHRRSIRKSASIGGSKILECDINYPGGVWVEHIITWRKQGIEVPIFIQFNGFPPHIDAGYQGRLRLVEQASIEMNDIRTNDEGWYECSIVFLDGTDDSSSNGTWIYLSVNSSPVLGQVSPSFLIQKEGDTVDLFCEATATPEPTLSWFKDGKELVQSDRVIISGNRVQVKNLERNDGGVYMCTFKNVVGEESHIIKLVIEGEGWISSGNAYIMVPPKNMTANEGTRVKLSCQAEGYPNNISYRWFKNNQDIQVVPGLMSRAGVYAEGSFVISSVIKEDTGWYKCRPSNGLGPPPEAQAYLNITYLPRVLNMPVRLFLPRGMMGRIDCPVEANPPATLIVWTKNEKVLEFSRTKRMKTNKQGTLVIYSVISTDEGRYACTPYSPLGAGQSSTPVQVLVRDPPHFVVRPKPIYQRQPTQSVTMPCMAEGDPKPSISWRKADGSFPSTTKTLQDGGNLTIVSLGKEDHGTYECVANNIVTSVITTSLLIIEITTPHAPYNVTVDTTQFSAKISWLPAYDGGFPQHYVLWYKMRGTNSGSEEWHTLRVVPDEATQIIVYKLYPDTNYEFTLLSRNSMGDGLFSKVVKAKTKVDSIADTGNPDETEGIDIDPTSGPKGPRPAPPENITVKQSRDGLLIKWQRPLKTPVPISHYHIEFRTVGQWVPLTGDITDGTQFLWKTVSRGAEYKFRVFSYSNTSHSSPSAVIDFNTKDAKGEGVRLSSGMIGGIVGGLLFLVVAFILALIAVKIFNKRKQREKAMRYGNVKYFGPKQVEANKNELTQFGDSRGGVISVADCWRTRIFTLQNGEDYDDYYSESSVSRERPYQPQLGYYEDLLGSEVKKSDRRHKKKARYQLDISRPIGQISRGRDGKFVLNGTNYNERYVNLALDSEESPGIIDRSPSYRSAGSPKAGAIMIRRQNSDSTDSGQYITVPVKIDSGPSSVKHTYRYLGQHDDSPYHAGVIIHPLLPVQPHQPSRKPEYNNRNYMTSSPGLERDGDSGVTFMASDLSSVLPSFSPVGTQSHSQLPRKRWQHCNVSNQSDRLCQFPTEFSGAPVVQSNTVTMDKPPLPHFNQERCPAKQEFKRKPLDPRPSKRRPSKNIDFPLGMETQSQGCCLLDRRSEPPYQSYGSLGRTRHISRPDSVAKVPPRLVLSSRDGPFSSSTTSKRRHMPGQYVIENAGERDLSTWHRYLSSRQPRTPHGNESADQPVAYTRDQLDRAVNRVRETGMQEEDYLTSPSHKIPVEKLWRKRSSPHSLLMEKPYLEAKHSRDHLNPRSLQYDTLPTLNRQEIPPDCFSRSYAKSYMGRVMSEEVDLHSENCDPVKPYHPCRSNPTRPRGSKQGQNTIHAKSYITHGPQTFRVPASMQSVTQKGSCSNTGSGSLGRRTRPRHNSPPSYLRPSPEGARGHSIGSPDNSKSSGLGSKESSHLSSALSSSRPLGSPLPGPSSDYTRSLGQGSGRGLAADISRKDSGPKSGARGHPVQPVVHSSQVSADENYEFDKDLSESDLIDSLKNSTYPDMDPSVLDQIGRKGSTYSTRSAHELHQLSVGQGELSDQDVRLALLKTECATNRHHHHRDNGRDDGYYGDKGGVACEEIESEML